MYWALWIPRFRIVVVGDTVRVPSFQKLQHGTNALSETVEASVQGLGFRVQGFRVQGLGLGLRVYKRQFSPRIHLWEAAGGVEKQSASRPVDMLFVLNVEAIESGTTASAVPLLSLSSMTVSLSSYTHTPHTQTHTHLVGCLDCISGVLWFRETCRIGSHSKPSACCTALWDGIRYPNISFHNRFDQDFGVQYGSDWTGILFVILPTSTSS